MSTQKLVYEGSDPERLLLDVWNEHGTEALISEPERIAKGGVFGFFAKSHYRVEVEPRRRPKAPAATSGPGAALNAMVEDTEDVFERPSAKKGSFDQVLAGVASSLGEDPGTFAARNVGGVGQLLNRTERPRPKEGARMVTSRVEEPAVAPSPRPRMGGEGIDPSGVELPEVGRHEIDEDPIEQLRLAGFPQRLCAMLEARGMTEFSLEAAFALLPPVPALPRVAGALIALVGPLEEAFALAERVGSELDIAPSEIACATPNRPNAGASRSRSGADQAAATLGGRSIAPDLLVYDAESASALSPGWRRDRIGIVAVAATDEPEERRWARTMLRALRPSATIALADARTKKEDLAHFLAAIGGVDAIAIERAASTVTPATLLALGLPIARLDGVEANGSAWASIVRAASVRRSN